MDYTSANKIEDNQTRIEILRYLSFWPYFLISLIFFLLLSFIYLRYAEYKYEATAIVEIKDEAQDSEMALPTSMTIFNRSMINLQNEIGILSSYSLHEKVVNELKYNIKYFTSGNLKVSENHHSQWFENYNITYKENLDNLDLPLSYNFISKDNGFIISEINSKNDVVNEKYFSTLNTNNVKHDFPFEIEIISVGEKKDFNKTIKLLSLENATEALRSSVSYNQTASESDQIEIKIRYPNKIIANEYINTLISSFDRDGINDRQLEYKRTIEFADSRSEFLSAELEKIENNRQLFKENNNLTDIKSNAEINISQQFSYDSELFKANSQKELLNMFKNVISDDEFKLLPVEIGIENSVINDLTEKYNVLLNERDRYLLSAGVNNSFIKLLEKQLKDYFNNTTIAVKTNKIAKIYSVIFLALVFFIKILRLFPKIAQMHMDGKQTIAAVITKNIVAIRKFSSVGKKPEATVIATAHAFGLMN
mgnify:CR=1 FL=1